MRNIYKYAVVIVFTAGVAMAAIITDDNQGWGVISANPPNPTTTQFSTQPEPSVWVSGIEGVEFQSNGDVGGNTFDDILREGTDLAINVAAEGSEVIFFDFYDNSVDYGPDEMSVYLQTYDGVEWFYDLNAPADSANGWASYTASLLDVGTWETSTFGQDFVTSLYGGDLLFAGVRVLYDTKIGIGGAQEYGISDFTFGYAVPEPGSFVVLSTALMSLGFTYARRKKEQKAA